MDISGITERASDLVSNEMYEDLEELLGKPVSSEYMGYYKYRFTLRVKTDKGYEFTGEYPNDNGDVYKFCPEDDHGYEYCQSIYNVRMPSVAEEMEESQN